MSLNGDARTRGHEGEVILVVDDEPVLPAMQMDPIRLWLICDDCGEEITYQREYGVGESATTFMGFAKAGLADAFNEHMLEGHD